MAGDNPLDRAIFDDNSLGFVNRLLGIGTIKGPPSPPPQPPIDPALVARAQRPPPPPAPTPPIAPPIAAPPTYGAVRPSPNDVPGAKPPDDPLAVPQPYQSRVLAPGGPAAEYEAYRKVINDQARKDAMFQQLGASLKGVGAAWSMNPAHVQALSGGSGTVPISMPAGPMSASDFLSFGDKTEAIRKNAVFEKGLPAVAKSLGLTLDQARDFKETNPEAFGAALNKLTPAEIAAAGRAERATVVAEKGAETAAAAEARQREKLTTIEQPEAQRAAEMYKRGTGPLSEAEVQSAAKQLNEDPEVVRGWQRAELVKKLEQLGQPSETVKTAREIQIERDKLVPPPEVAAKGPEAVKQWQQGQETPTQELERLRKELEVRGHAQETAAPEVIKQVSTLDQDSQGRIEKAGNRDQALQALHQGIIAGSPVSEAIVQFDKGWRTLTGQPPSKKAVDTDYYYAAMATEVLLDAQALGKGGQISDGDREFARAAAGQSSALSQESMRRILALKAQMDRRKIELNNDQIAEKYKNAPWVPKTASPAALPQINDDMRHFTDNKALTDAIRSGGRGGARDKFDQLYGKGYFDSITNPTDGSMDDLIRAKITGYNPGNKLYDTRDDGMFNALKTLTPAEMKDPAIRADIEAQFKNGFKNAKGEKVGHMSDNNFDGLYDLIFAAKQAGRF